MARKPEDASGTKTEQTGFPDFTRMLEEMKFPSFGDVTAFVRANQRNMDVFVAANRLAMQTSQAYVRQHMDIVQGGLARLSELMQTFAEAGEPRDKMTKQLELLKQARAQAITNMEELGALIQKSNHEVVRLLNERFTQAIDELEGMIAKTGHSGS